MMGAAEMMEMAGEGLELSSIGQQGPRTGSAHRYSMMRLSSWEFL